MARRDPSVHRKIDLNRLRWTTVFMPVVGVLATEVLRHYYLDERFGRAIGSTFLFGVLGVGALAFSRYVFNLIAEREASVVALLEEARLRRAQAEGVYRLGLQISSLAGPAPDLRRVMHEVRRLTGADVASWWTVDGKSGAVVVDALDGQQRVTPGSIRLHLGQGLAGRAGASGKPVKTEKFPDDLTDTPQSYPLLVAENLRSALAVPGMLRDEVRGVLLIGSRQPRRISGEDEIVLTSLAHQIAIALDNMRLLTETEDVSMLRERERLAREVHDGVAQALGVLNLEAARTRQLLSEGRAEEVGRQLEEMSEIIGEAYRDIRHAIVDLKLTPVSGDLISTLANYLYEFGRKSGLEAEFTLAAPDDLRLHSTVEIHLIRIVQEALANVRKHAEASRVRLRVTHRPEQDALEVVVEDNGRGMESGKAAREDHFGLATMRERAQLVGGSLKIETAPGQGTRVIVSVPIGRPVAERVGRS